MDSYKIVTVLISLIVVSQHCAFANRQSYGENCNEIQKCNSTNGLTCDNGTCACTKPDEMIFNFETNSCVAHGLCACDYGHHQELDGSCSRFKNMFERCTTNAECDADSHVICHNNRCNCNPLTSVFREGGVSGYLTYDSYCESHDRSTSPGMTMKCLPSYGHSCYSYAPCGSNLVCQKYKCECPKDFQTFDRKTLSCKSLSRDPCNIDNDCTPNSICVKHFGYNVCKCRNGFTEDSKRECQFDKSFSVGEQQPYGQSCSRSTPCAKKLVCRNGECKCPLEGGQFFDPQTLSCKSLSRGPCNIDNDCTPNSICVNKSGYNVCECRNGFTEAANGKCLLSYGSFCEGEQQSSYYPEYSRCNTESGLSCINNACSCSHSEMYDENDNTCKILAGAVCTKSEDIGTKSCVNNASCVLRIPNLRGSCTCLKGFVQSVNRSCNQIRNFVTNTRGKNTGQM